MEVSLGWSQNPILGFYKTFVLQRVLLDSTGVEGSTEVF